MLTCKITVKHCIFNSGHNTLANRLDDHFIRIRTFTLTMHIISWELRHLWGNGLWVWFKTANHLTQIVRSMSCKKRVETRCCLRPTYSRHVLCLIFNVEHIVNLLRLWRPYIKHESPIYSRGLIWMIGASISWFSLGISKFWTLLNSIKYDPSSQDNYNITTKFNYRTLYTWILTTSYKTFQISVVIMHAHNNFKKVIVPSSLFGTQIVQRRNHGLSFTFSLVFISFFYLIFLDNV